MPYVFVALLLVSNFKKKKNLNMFCFTMGIEVSVVSLAFTNFAMYYTAEI